MLNSGALEVKLNLSHDTTDVIIQEVLRYFGFDFLRLGVVQWLNFEALSESTRRLKVALVLIKFARSYFATD